MMKKIRNYDKEERWVKMREVCKVCQKIKKFSQVENENQTKEAKCQTCGFAQNNWICLICGHIGCGRYNSAHASDHFQSTYHNFALEIDSLRYLN
jgi:Isopeptidase T